MFRSLLTLPSLFTRSVRQKSYEVVSPHRVSPQISFDSLSVPLPLYAKTGTPPPLANQHEPEIKSPEAIAKMRTSCQLAKKILDSVADIVRVGVTTDEIDKFVHHMTISNNAVRPTTLKAFFIDKYLIKWFLCDNFDLCAIKATLLSI